MVKKIFTSIALVAICLTSFGQALNPMQVIENDPDVRVGKLESGATYYVCANKKDPQRANFHIVYGVGAVQEEDNQNGLAHFLEHMAFNGSKNFPDNKLIDYLQSIGVRFGENLNAFTSQEVTSYMVTNVPITREGIIDSALLVLHDWAGFISLNDKDIDEERGVIREEWRQGNSAYRRAWDKQMQTLFFDNIYGKRNIIGNEDVLKSFKYQDIKDFYHKWYRPDMQAFIVVGDFDPDMMVEKLKKTMSDIKPFDVQTPKAVVPTPNSKEARVSIYADPELSTTDVDFYVIHKPIPNKYNNTLMAYKQGILNALFGTIMSERLDAIKMSENAPFLNAYGGYHNYIEPIDMLNFSASAKDGEALKALEAIYTEVLRADKGGFLQSELDRAKANLLSDYENRYKNRNDRKNQQFVDQFSSNFLDNNPIPSAEKEFALQKTILDAITLGELNQTVKAYVTDENNAVSISMTKKDGIAVPTEAEVLAVLAKVRGSEIEIKKEEVNIRPLIATELEGSPVVSTTESDFGSTVWTLKNGLQVTIKKTDLKADEIIFSANQKGGGSVIKDLSTLFASKFYSMYMQMAGLGDFSKVELNKALAGKNARVNAGIGANVQTIYGSCSPKDLETMLQLVYLNYTAPRFDTMTYKTFKNQYQTIFTNFATNPDITVQNELSATLYNNNPREPKMDAELLNKFGLQDIAAAHKIAYSNADKTIFTIVGNYDEAVLKPLVEKYLGSLPVSQAVAEVGTYNAEPVKGKVENTTKTKMETPKVTAYTVYSGDWTGTSAQDIAIDAIKYVLEIRYTKSVREEAGGTYGVGTQMVTEYAPKPNYMLYIMFNTDASKIESLQPIIYKEINDLMANGPKEEDLAKAKENFAKKFAEVNNSNSAWMGYINEKSLWGVDNYTNFLKEVEALNVDVVKQAAKDLFDQGNICTVIQYPQE